MTQPFIEITQLTPGSPKISDNYPAVDVTDPTQNITGTTKKYLLGDLFNLFLQQIGFSVYPTVTAASTINLNATYNNGIGGINATLTDASGTFAPFTLDGITGALTNVPYLIKNQLNQFENGIYFLTQNGDGISLPWILIRTFYFNSPSNIIDNKIVSVAQGNTQADTSWQLSVVSPVVVGTTPIIFNPFTITPFAQPWQNITAISATMDPNTGYIANNNATRVQLLLPSVCPRGSIIEVSGLGAAGWQITQNALQSINDGILTTSIGLTGSLSSTQQYDAVRLLCTVANRTFNVLSSQGNLTVV